MVLPDFLLRVYLCLIANFVKRKKNIFSRVTLTQKRGGREVMNSRHGTARDFLAVSHILRFIRPFTYFCFFNEIWERKCPSCDIFFSPSSTTVLGEERLGKKVGPNFSWSHQTFSSQLFFALRQKPFKVKVCLTCLPICFCWRTLDMRSCFLKSWFPFQNLIPLSLRMKIAVVILAYGSFFPPDPDFFSTKSVQFSFGEKKGP